MVSSKKITRGRWSSKVINN